MVNCIVVDDNQGIVDVFCDLLNLIGLDVLGTGMDDMDAVKLYEKHRPDLIFIDLLMPRYDGLYAIRNIKEIDMTEQYLNPYHYSLGFQNVLKTKDSNTL